MLKDKCVNSNVKTWRYQFPNENGQGWGIIVLDAIGFFAAITCWGNFTYFWNLRRWAENPDKDDFRRWFLSCDDWYLADKLNAGMHCWGHIVDREETAKAFRRVTLTSRRERYITKEDARDEWKRIQIFENGDACEHELVQCSILNDAWELPVRKQLKPTHGFFTHLMPRLRQAIRDELAAEAGTRKA